MCLPVDPVMRPQGYSGPGPVASAASIQLAADTCTSVAGAGLIPYFLNAAKMPKLFVEYVGTGDSDKPTA
jgi:hypothetical protein